VNLSAQFDHESVEHFLHSLDTAIDEARRVRSSIATSSSDNLAKDWSARWRLMLVDREIELLESKLTKVRDRVGPS
jgi:hypothetical protein